MIMSMINRSLNTTLNWKLLELDSSTTLKLAAVLWLAYLLILAVLETFLIPASQEWRWFKVVHGLNALLFLGYVFWPGMRLLIGRWFMPVAIFLLSLLPISIDFLVVVVLPDSPASLPEAAALRLLPVLFFGLVLTAWTYSWRVVVAYCVGTAVFHFFLSHIFRPTGPVEDNLFASNLLLILTRTVTFLVVGYLMNFIVTQQNRLQQDLAEANTKLMNYATTAERLAESRERNRVARELHDTLAHTLSGLTVQLETVEAYWEPDPDTAHLMLSKALANSRSGLVETRRALKALRATPVDDLGLILALRRLGEQTAARAPFSVNLMLPISLPDTTPDVEQCIYRTAQEALTNVVRHAAAQQVDMTLTHNTNGFMLRVQDDGRGLDVEQKQNGEHFGLVGMQERAALVGGELTIESTPGQGTSVVLTI